MWPVECCPTLQMTVEHTVDSEHPKHAQWVTCLVSMQAMEEMEHFQHPGIVYRSLRLWTVHYHAETRGDGGGLMAQWASLSCHGMSVHSNCHR